MKRNEDSCEQHNTSDQTMNEALVTQIYALRHRLHFSNTISPSSPPSLLFPHIPASSFHLLCAAPLPIVTIQSACSLSCD